MSSPAPTQHPIRQLVTHPQVLKRETYRNAYSSDNPDGSLEALYAFRALTNPAPAVGVDYTPSGSTVEDLYGMVVTGATADVGATFASEEFSNAREAFSESALAPLDIEPDEKWRPVYAQPADWYDADAVLEVAASVAAPAGATQPVEITLAVLAVTLERPWLKGSLLAMSGWTLGQQPPGWVSTGTATGNDGQFPLLPVQMLVGFAAKVPTEWIVANREVIGGVVEEKGYVDVGPVRFFLDAGTDIGTLTEFPALVEPYLAGFVSAVVPFSPPRPAD